jgi:hypothetical protein
MNGRNALATIGASLTTALGLCALTCLLPDEPYQRWQLAEPVFGGLYTNLRWAYERIHFDDRPVDIAVVGASKTLLGVSAARVEQHLAARGLTAHVANLSTNGDGRNVQWAVVDELLKTKSPAVIVVGVDAHPALYGHAVFKYIAPTSAIVAPPAPLLHNYIYDLAYLPARQAKLFAARFLPHLFALRNTFDPAIYARTQSDYTSGILHFEGKNLDMGREVPAETLLSQRQPDDRKSVVDGFEDWCCNDGDDRVYIRAIAADARAHGVQLIFDFVPTYGSSELADRDFLSQYGTVLDNGFLARNSKLFMNFWHLNHAGAIANSDRIAAAIFELKTSITDQPNVQ